MYQLEDMLKYICIWRGSKNVKNGKYLLLNLQPGIPEFKLSSGPQSNLAILVFNFDCRTYPQERIFEVGQSSVAPRQLIQFRRTHLYSWVERGTVKIDCFSLLPTSHPHNTTQWPGQSSNRDLLLLHHRAIRTSLMSSSQYL